MPADASPPRWWGYHRLSERGARRLVATADIRPGDLVLDIGAGDGAITARLAAAGARVIAIELHPARASCLRERFAGSNVKVVRADATDLRLPTRPFKVVANPPFAVSAAIMRRLLSRHSALDTAALALPRQMANRWARESPATFRLQISAQLQRREFSPPARRAIAVLTVRRRST